MADAEEVANKVKAYINETYRECHKLKDYGRVAGYSKFYVARLFREATGTTIGEHLQHVRLEKLKELLRTTKTPFYKLVYEVGFSSPGQVSTIFKAKVGCTSKEYRRSAA